MGDTHWCDHRKPSFEVISALLSRCQVYTLKSFEKEDLETLLQRAITTDEVLSTKIIILRNGALIRLSEEMAKITQYF